MKSFEASYSGECSDCGVGFKSETLIRYRSYGSGEIVHDKCPEPAKVGEICGSCFTTKSLAGICDNCD